MNQWEIEELANRFAKHPVLGEAARFLNDYKDVINGNSDGWAYWSIASQAARKLVTLLEQAAQNRHLPLANQHAAATAADVKKAVVPIKSFCTRKNLPCPRPPYEPVPPLPPLRHELGPCVVIYCEDWFQRADFMEWLNKYINPPNERRTATWHSGGAAHEGSDTFILYDHGEGSDFEVLPEDIWEEIVRICESYRLEWAVVWLQNLPHQDQNNTDGKTKDISSQSNPSTTHGLRRGQANPRHRRQ